jgi:para-nitrobenzyl esterase
MAMSIIDGRFLVEPPEVSLAAGRQAKVPILIGANDRDLPIGSAVSKDDVFSNFGPDGGAARALYDPRGDQTLNELKQQVFADRALVEPSRHLANEAARAEQPVWLYRFAYVSEAQRGENMGTLHGFEIPFAMNVPGALVADKLTRTDALMGRPGQRILGILRPHGKSQTGHAAGVAAIRPGDRSVNALHQRRPHRR